MTAKKKGNLTRNNKREININYSEKKSSSYLIGSWAFLIGLILAAILGLGYTGKFQDSLLWIVFLLGIVVGLLNITHQEVVPFLTSGTVLVLVSYLGLQVGIFDKVLPFVENILQGILTLFVPATLIVAIKAVFVMARK
ncbi:hypothetical protein J4437_04190 [Candidatus Woesearchaeota archaeon]|nr:hypothetical protein [uncultured archaeon]MBS3123808.1 hypothetical protein [Candidatus Woesearchaeota archaeon]